MWVTSSDGDRKKTQVTLTNTKIHVALSQARTVVQLGGATFPSPRRMRSIVREVPWSPPPQHEVLARAVPEAA